MPDASSTLTSDAAYRALEETRGAYSEVLAHVARDALAYIAAITAELAPDVAFIEIDHGDQDYSGYHNAVGYFDVALDEVDDTDDLDDALLNAAAFTDLDDATADHYRNFVVERDDCRYLDLTKVRSQLT